MTGPDKIAENALVLACDAHKALFLRNTGTATTPSLTTEKVMEAEHRGEVKNADRPGRWPDSMAAGGEKGPRSAAEPPDYHRIDEEAFAEQICEVLHTLHHRNPLKHLLIAAPPQMLGMLRKHMPDDVASAIQAEVDKDLTKMPVDRLTDTLLQG